MSVQNGNFWLYFLQQRKSCSLSLLRRVSAFLAVKVFVFIFLCFLLQKICFSIVNILLILSGIYVGKKIIFFYCVFGEISMDRVQKYLLFCFFFIFGLPSGEDVCVCVCINRSRQWTKHLCFLPIFFPFHAMTSSVKNEVFLVE